MKRKSNNETRLSVNLDVFNWRTRWEDFQIVAFNDKTLRTTLSRNIATAEVLIAQIVLHEGRA